jgi:hypothetical protein
MGYGWGRVVEMHLLGFFVREVCAFVNIFCIIGYRLVVGWREVYSFGFLILFDRIGLFLVFRFWGFFFGFYG